ncbi:uncharacterized protein LOC143905862 [Temnothorax americanus]|uniref:uncharacterized protein LOC143905862 n=1 Tax=Temnothorax americanus TaxID=1964332 RepID=UPI004067A78B
MDELFGPLEKPPPDCPWPSALLNFVQSTARKGLVDEQRTGLLKQHEATGHLAVLGPPKLNKLLTPALKTAASVVKRDEHQASAQVQVAAPLNAFGSAIAELLAPEVREQLPESVNPVLRRLAKGLYLLADHQYRLSLARRAFIKPSLSLMGKGVADDAPIDEWLFGTAFAEELKDAQACEKAAPREAAGSAEKDFGKRESPCPSEHFVGSPSRGTLYIEPLPEIPLSLPLPPTPLAPEETSSTQDAFPGCSQVIREAFRIRQVPEPSLDALLASLAPSTLKQYTRPIRAWWSFCRIHKTSPFFPKVSEVLGFLTEELERAGSFSTLNTSRSAISLLSCNTIGEDPLIKRFCKGASVLKPPRPRYDHIWDPAPVISKLGTFFPHEDLSLERVTKKLALLLALGSGQRCQTLAALRRSQISITEEKMIFTVPDRIKTSAPGRRQPLLIFSRFTERSNLCIVNLLEHSLRRTKNLRPDNCDKLFISLKRPHKAVGVQSISRWIRETLNECGVDGNFTAHSTRHASTSYAAKKGDTIDLIKRAAGWSAEARAFAKLYNRPIVDTHAFANAVLSD